jgi:adenine-specific DNA-methyltransferase
LISKMKLFSQNLETGSKTSDILWEIGVKNGFRLCAHITEINTRDSEYFMFEENSLAVIVSNFTDSIQKDIISRKPKRIIALDAVFNNQDSVKANAILKFEEEGIPFNSI